VVVDYFLSKIEISFFRSEKENTCPLRRLDFSIGDSLSDGQDVTRTRSLSIAFLDESDVANVLC
jgi:hypothetical protein